MPATFAEPLNMSLWTSANRILTGYRFRAYGESAIEAGRGPVVPEDVAAVVQALHERELATMGEMVAAAREIDVEMTEHGRSAGMSIPSGGSIFEPYYRQYLDLAATPPLTDDIVWTGMPEELYLVNRLQNPTALDQEMLRLNGYVQAYETAAAGGKVFVEDGARMVKALEVQQLLASMNASKEIGTGTLIFGFVALFLVAGTVAAIFVIKPAIESKMISDGIVSALNYNKDAAEWNGQTAEQTSRIVDVCIAQAQAAGVGVENCSDLLQRLHPYQAPLNPGTVAEQIARVTSCTGKCGKWTILGGTIGALAGFVAAKRWFG